jgi:outer membrane receptor protein involved in Fe transport
VGNSSLQAAKAWNYEVNTSFFGPEIGLISLSAFYKDISDMFHMVDGINIDSPRVLDSLGIRWKSPFPEGQRFRFTYPYNSTHPTKVWGIELEHQANLSFLPGLLKHLVLNYNLSVFRSETYVTTSRVESYFKTVPGIPFPVEDYRFVLYESRQKLETQPEFFGNVAVGYDIDGFSARVSVFFQSEFNRSFSGDGKSDQIQGGYSRWDCALKQKLSDHVSIFLNANNLTNFEEASFIRNRTGVNKWTVPNTSERYDLTADLGVRLTF